MSMLVIQTVRGPISPESLGFALPHEHVMCDFIGAAETGPQRWDPDEVVAVMQPYLQRIRDLGVRGFVDCSPAFIARDPLVLRRLSEATGLHIVTNAGLYKEPFLPPYAFAESADQLADRWIAEIREGIGDTGIRAGFVKIAVNPGPLIPIQQKIVRAAARAQIATGAVVASHTASGVAALEQLDILEREGADPGRFIFVHADVETEERYHLQVAARGAWVEYDQLKQEEEARSLQLIRSMVDAGYSERLLISHDAGWYNVGEAGGGQVRGYEYIPQRFVAQLRDAGCGEGQIHQLTVTNPARAFSLPAS